MGFVLDTLLIHVQKYTNNMVKLVEERTRDYFLEKKITEDLLYELLPKY